MGPEDPCLVMLKTLREAGAAAARMRAAPAASRDAVARAGIYQT